MKYRDIGSYEGESDRVEKEINGLQEEIVKLQLKLNKIEKKIYVANALMVAKEIHDFVFYVRYYYDRNGDFWTNYMLLRKCYRRALKTKKGTANMSFDEWREMIDPQLKWYRISEYHLLDIEKVKLILFVDKYEYTIFRKIFDIKQYENIDIRERE